MNPLLAVSVIIPCCNAAAFLPATLRSVLAQQGFELQVIVVDDGSTDGSADLVQRDFPEVRLVRQPNRGVASARNAGLALARHDWVAFIDADDLWLPGKLQAQWALLASQPDAAMAYTAWQVWTSSEPEPTTEWLAHLAHQAADRKRWQGASGWIYPELLVDCVVWTSTVLARAALLREAGGFDETLRVCEDWDLWLRLSRRTPILRVPQPLALYRMHGGSITRTPQPINFKELVIERALQRWGVAGPDGRVARIADIRMSQARTWRDRAGAWLQAGDLKSARRETWRALHAQPVSLHGWTLAAKIMGALR